LLRSVSASDLGLADRNDIASDTRS
jgi:hypothetical protein